MGRECSSPGARGSELWWFVAGAEAVARAAEAAEIDALDPFSLASPTDSSADGSGPEGVPPLQYRLVSLIYNCPQVLPLLKSVAADVPGMARGSA